MAVLAKRASDVRINEVDLSTTISQVTNAVSCFVVVSKQGPIKPTFESDPDSFLFKYGNPDAKVSFDQYCALDYFREGNAAWLIRVVGAGALHSSAIVKNDVSGNTLITALSGVADPEIGNWDTWVSAGQVPLFLIYANRGPGSYGDNIACSISSENLSAPANLTAGSAITGGTLAAATYTYSVSAISRNGETLATTPVTVIIGSATSTNVVNLAWDTIPNAIGYKIYGRVGPNLGYLGQVGATTGTFQDDGSYIVDTSKSPITSPSALAAPATTFTLKVFDLTVSSSTPMETFNCSMLDQTDESGVQMEIEQRINRFSKYIRVLSNFPSLLTTPTVRSTSTYTALAGGDSGAAPTSADINRGWDTFKGKEQYKIDVMVNSGRVDPIVQLHMDSIAQRRADCVAFLDVPPSQQQAQDAVDFRNLTLNLNSSYSALFGPDLYESDPISGKVLYVPPSGAMAGLMARTVRVAQPWFSIAGLNRGLLNVLDVRYTYDDGSATLLFQSQVNYMRKFVGKGIPLWEQQTLYAKQSALQFLNVRVLCNVIKRSVYEFLIYGIQEPNDDILSRQLKFGIEEYLRAVQSARGISSFRVIISPSNNPPALTNTGVLAIGVYIVPILATHEIQLTLLVGKVGLEISEAEVAALS